MNPQTIEQKRAGGQLTEVDVHFSRLMSRLGSVADPDLQLLFADLSHNLGNQHTCLDISSYEGGEALAASLLALPIVGTGETGTPLVLDGNRLYMQRYYAYERRVADWLASKNRLLPGRSTEAVARALRAQFKAAPADERQALATLQPLLRGLTIITGGPGTGKTTTVVKILGALRDAEGDTPLTIRLAAPTGKAAMRLEDATRRASPPVDVDVRTLHRLLGMRADGRSYRHDASNPLDVDVLIVDEVSMVDLSMMYRLLSALPDEARLVLLGDPNQLPSVEAGNILGDICKYPAGYTRAFRATVRQITGFDPPGAPPAHLLADAVCHLEKNYRFSPDRSIANLARQIREGDNVVPHDDDELKFCGLAEFETRHLETIYADYLGALTRREDVQSLLRAFEQVRILTPIRDGDFGVVAINERLEAMLEQRGMIDREQRYYHGRPVLIMRNDYNLKLFNGDTGICIHMPADPEPTVVFRDAAGETRSYLASRLPPHETCFAMTVHKSQGSEFDHVVLVLPQVSSDSTEQIMTRELVYTAITRAKTKVTVYFDGDTLDTCLQRRSARLSGLGERLLSRPSGEQLDLF